MGFAEQGLLNQDSWFRFTGQVLLCWVCWILFCSARCQVCLVSFTSSGLLGWVWLVRFVGLSLLGGVLQGHFCLVHFYYIKLLNCTKEPPEYVISDGK